MDIRRSIQLSCALSLLVPTVVSGRTAAKIAPVPDPTLAPVLVKSADDIPTLEEVLNIHHRETLAGTGNESQAFEAAAVALSIVLHHFHSGNPNTLEVRFDPVPPPLLGANGRNAASQCAAERESAMQQSSGGEDWLSLDEALSQLESETAASSSGGDFDVLGLTGNWTRSYFPNDPYDPEAGGLGLWTANPDFANCLDLGGEFGVGYGSMDYGDGGPGESFLTVGWSWSLGAP